MSYRPKFAKFVDIIKVGSARLKFYDLAENIDDVSNIDRNNALDCMIENATIFNQENELGFVINHRCGEQYLLLVCSFRNENEIWETVYYNGSGSFKIWERKPPHLATFCVWEMGIVYHESQAYKQFLGTPQQENDIQNYLKNTFDGEV